MQPCAAAAVRACLGISAATCFQLSPLPLLFAGTLTQASSSMRMSMRWWQQCCRGRRRREPHPHRSLARCCDGTTTTLCPHSGPVVCKAMCENLRRRDPRSVQLLFDLIYCRTLHGTRVPSRGFLPSQPSCQTSSAPCNLTVCAKSTDFRVTPGKASAAQHASKGISCCCGGGGSGAAPPGPRQPLSRSASFRDLLPCLHLPALAGVWRPRSALHTPPPPRRHRPLIGSTTRPLVHLICNTSVLR